MAPSAPLWRIIQKQNFTRLDRLIKFLELTPEQSSQLLQRPNFPLNLPLRLAQKIAKSTLEDPLLRQFIPLQNEITDSPGYLPDPVGDLAVQRSQKILCKYHGRALILTTRSCAMHCRYCFRQNFPYETASTGYSRELDLLRSDPSLEEVILSGGDPLSLSTDSLGSLLTSLADIRHLKRIRFHTRFPIGIPERIDKFLLNQLQNVSQQVFFVLHTNHPREFDEEVLKALTKLKSIGIPLLNQTVLLKGVNDKEEILLSLCKELINHGILPYYLHLLDKVSGSAHFEVSAERGKELIRYLHEHLSGFGVPKLVREEAGEKGKTLIA